MIDYLYSLFGIMGNYNIQAIADYAIKRACFRN